MRGKIQHVQAKSSAGQLIFDDTKTGKKYKKPLIREAMLKMDALNVSGIIRFQETGAKGWSYFDYTCKAGECQYIGIKIGETDWWKIDQQVVSND